MEHEIYLWLLELEKRVAALEGGEEGGKSEVSRDEGKTGVVEQPGEPGSGDPLGLELHPIEPEKDAGNEL